MYQHRKRLVKVQVTDVTTTHCRVRQANLGVEVRTI